MDLQRPRINLHSIKAEESKWKKRACHQQHCDGGHFGSSRREQVPGGAVVVLEIHQSFHLSRRRVTATCRSQQYPTARPAQELGPPSLEVKCKYLKITELSPVPKNGSSSECPIKQNFQWSSRQKLDFFFFNWFFLLFTHSIVKLQFVKWCFWTNTGFILQVFWY